MACPHSARRLAVLLDVVRRGENPDLTFILEEVGRLANERGCYDEAADVILPYLDHESALLREGAIYGLGYLTHAREDVRVRLMRVGWDDISPGVRDAANEALE